MKTSASHALKRFVGLSAAILLALVSAARAQTNNPYFDKGDMTFSVQPSLLMPASSSKAKSAKIGYEITSYYWQTLHTATGLQIGKQDLTDSGTGYIDHIEALAAYRITPFATPILSRVALIGFTGAETYIQDNSKGLELGLSVEIALTRQLRITGKASQHFETTADKSGNELAAGLQWRF